jgi:hypothetical protein
VGTQTDCTLMFSFDVAGQLSTEAGCRVAGKRSSVERAALDPALRERVVGHIAPFVDALDEAVVNPESGTIEDLQKAADELMRAIARVLLELGRSSDSDNRHHR